MQTKKYYTVDEYIKNLPPKTMERFLELRECIFMAAPDAIEMINYNIPAYALIEGGKRDQQIMIAGYEKHVGFYPHPITIEHFSDELKTYKQGKGSVQFLNTEPLPIELIIRMIEYRKKSIDNQLK